MESVIRFVVEHRFALGVTGLVLLLVLARSWVLIGPTEVGLVLKRVGRSLRGDDPVAFAGEAGWQAGLLMPGLRFRLWPLFAVRKHPWVQIPADHENAAMNAGYVVQWWAFALLTLAGYVYLARREAHPPVTDSSFADESELVAS